MKEIIKIFYKVSFFFLIIFSAEAQNKVLSIGSDEAKITVKVFSSLTCPHCANFHENIFSTLEKEFIENGVVKFEHHAFPLDLAALNAEIIVRCGKNNKKNFQLLGEVYKKQNKWAVGSDINKINENLKKIALESGLTLNKIDQCLNNDNVQDLILNERIKAQKNYKIDSTPTIYINEKKYKGDHKYKEFKKTLEKFL